MTTDLKESLLANRWSLQKIILKKTKEIKIKLNPINFCSMEMPGTFTAFLISRFPRKSIFLKIYINYLYSWEILFFGKKNFLTYYFEYGEWKSN